MVFNKNGSLLYVAIMYGNYIETVDTFLWKRTGFIYGVGAAPRDLIIDKEGKYIYCSANQGNNIARVDTSKNKVLDALYVGVGPRTLEFSPDEKTIYVCCYRSNRLYVVDVKTFKVIDILPTGLDPVGVAISPSGDIWVTDQGDSTLSVFQHKTCAKNLSGRKNI
jgi:YVTN family beta-propeller protein